jgi:hypothetical protein
VAGWRIKAIVTVGASAALLVVAWSGLAWFSGMPPSVLVARILYDDVPRIEIPLQLNPSAPVAFAARILEKRNYWLNLRIYFGGVEQRKQVSDVVGDARSVPVHVPGPSEVATEVHVVIRDQERRVVHERTVRSVGRSDTAGDSLGRRLDEFVLDTGRYDISITPAEGVAEFRPFRTTIELTYHPKTTADR